MIGQVIDHYRITEKIGQGGMGEVYKAVDVNLDRVVAIKVLSKELSQDPNLIQRFQSEAKTQAQMNHPNICTLYNFFNYGGQLFMVMEYIEGLNLEQLVHQRGPIPYPEAIPLFQQALFGLSQAHRLGVIHRDIKPSNIIINRQGIAKVMDFGIARVVGHSRLTRTGLQVGTLYYMCPEQIQGKDVDFRGDIYALGITLFELLTGKVPFSATTDYEIMQAHIKTPPPAPSRILPNLPKVLDRVILKALEKDPRNRYQTVEEFSQALSAGLQEALQTAPPELKKTVAFVPGSTRAATPGATVAYQTGAASGGLGATVAGTAMVARPGVDKKKMLIIGGIAAAAVVFVLIAAVALAIILGKKRDKPVSTISGGGGVVQSGSQNAGPPVARPTEFPSSGGKDQGPVNPNSLPGLNPPEQKESPAEPEPSPSPGPSRGEKAPPSTPQPPSPKSSPPAPPPEPEPGPSQANSALQQALSAAHQAYSEQRYVEPPNNNVIHYTNLVLRMDSGNSYARELQGDAIGMVNTQIQQSINAGNLAQAKRLTQALLTYFPNNAQYRQILQGLEVMEQQAAATANAETFLVAHDHTGDFGSFCVGYLYILPDRVVYRTARTMDGRTDDFEVSRSTIKEFKTNRIPIGAFNCFHIKLKNGNNYNFAHIDQNGNDLGPDVVVNAYEDTN
jgi:serine/threonine protein kinase